MDIMKLTRELGRALQQDQTYINMSVAEQQCNEDEALQNAIGEFNLKRMAINNEAGKEDRSEELIEQYNKELREIYGRVMQNEHMAAYQAAKNEFDALMQRVTGVLSMCAEGQDPDGCDPDACGWTGRRAAPVRGALPRRCRLLRSISACGSCFAFHTVYMAWESFWQQSYFSLWRSCTWAPAAMGNTTKPET